MDRFIACLCDNNYKALLIDGDAPDKELSEAWVLILSEYYELKGESINGVQEWRLSRDIIRLQNHLYLLGKCIDFLKDRYSESVAESVRRLGYPFNPAKKEPYEYLNNLQVIVNKSKTKFIQLRQLQKELEQKTKTLTEQQGPRREDFETMVTQVEEMQGVAYSMDTMTVSKYLVLEKKLIKKIEAIEAKKK